jgi:preprotein translocase subunit SecG
LSVINIIAIAIQIIGALLLIVLILLHAGKGGGLSDMFGGGGVGLSGGTRMERTLDKITVTAAIIWGLNTFYLAYASAHGGI